MSVLMQGICQDYSMIKKTIQFSTILEQAKTIKDLDFAADEPQNVVSLKLLITDSVEIERFINLIPKLSNIRKIVIDNYYDFNLTLPQEIWTLTKLEFISLHNLRIDNFNGLDSLTDLKYLALMGARMKTIPKEIYKLSNLEYLDFCLNYLDSIPDDLILLEKLRELDLTNNCFIKIPESVTKLTHLEYLDFDNSETVNDKFADGQSFCYNRLSCYPDLSKMSALKKISVYKLIVSDKEIVNKLEKAKKFSGKIKSG